MKNFGAEFGGTDRTSHHQNLYIKHCMRQNFISTISLLQGAMNESQSSENLISNDASAVILKSDQHLQRATI